jgi:hypothetical protein
LVVNPYLKQCAPPEFSAMLPPIEHTLWLEGSGVEMGWAHHARDIQICDPGLGDDTLVVEVDLDDVAKARQDYQHALGLR